MRLQHFDYIRLVKETYKKKRASKELSLLLTQSTPAKIRQACLHVYKERYRKEDERVLKDFFGPAEAGRPFLQLIESFETDRFKPLDKYLKGDTERTDDRNLELLAWLIDFKYRPYSFDNNVQLDEEESAFIKDNQEEQPVGESEENKWEKTGDESVNDLKIETGEKPGQYKEDLPGPAKSVSEKEKKVRKNTGVMIGLLALVIGSGALYLMEDKAKSGCVYWAGEQYVPVPCEEEPDGRLIVPLNNKSMKRQRMITRKDTITEQLIGKIYYIKDGNKIKYYTEGGNYPEDVNRPLKKLSRYIFEKDSINRVR